VSRYSRSTLEGAHRDLCGDQIQDWRRLIVPLSHFIATSLQNRTHEMSAAIGKVFVCVDVVRDRLVAFLQQSYPNAARSCRS